MPLKQQDGDSGLVWLSRENCKCSTTHTISIDDGILLGSAKDSGIFYYSGFYSNDRLYICYPFIRHG
jgi:hypothetical protein